MSVVAAFSRTPAGHVRPALVWGMAAGVPFLFAADAWWPEWSLADAVFVAAVGLSIGAVAALAFGRVLAAVVIAGGLLAILRAASSVKKELSDLPLHAYDVVSLAISPDRAAALWPAHRGYALALFAALAATAVLAGLAARVDAVRLPRRYGVAAAAAFAALAVSAFVLKGDRRHDELFGDGSSLALFFASWPDALAAVTRGEVIEASARASGTPFHSPAVCAPKGKPPHIILIHEESVVQPSLFPQLSYDRSIDRFFHSHDGRLHRMRVETYGGASWLTEFSVLTGVSSRSAGGLRPFIQSVMAGKVRETLPQVLARCGYRNVAIYPMLRIFLGIDRFFAAAGIPEIRDANDQRATDANERDRFYFANALSELERHVTASIKPMFLFIETMATHGSYEYTYMPEVQVPGGGPGTTPQMHEYLRRLSMARIDYDAMLTELDRRFPGERFLIVHYGDHHPSPTMPLLGYDPHTTSLESIMRSGKDEAFITYYAVNGLRYAPPRLPQADVLDVPYLGTVILEAAGLPLPEVYRERKRLMAVCGGRYHGCPAQSEILSFHRRLIDSGLMDAL